MVDPQTAQAAKRGRVAGPLRLWSLEPLGEIKSSFNRPPTTMADPRIHQVAVQLGHVYYSRESEFNRTSHEHSTEAIRIMRFNDFKRTMIGPVNPRKFLDEFFKQWASVKFGEGDVIRTYDAVPPTTSYKEFIVDPLVSLRKRLSTAFVLTADVFCA